MFKVKKKTIISLMGVDGSGKTTVAKKLIKKFQGSKYLHLKLVKGGYIILLNQFP